jgi:malonate-semialdehyde dehydrogenase (acetylating)/methylmalonate-semialdehyde dehydrogenase
MPRIAKTLSAEQGKTIPDAEGDIFRGLEVVEHACSIGTLQQGEFAENVAGSVDTYTLRQPIGVCAGITPFNFPAMIPLWMFPMAIVCGNTFVLKPSEQDPLSTMQLVELAIEAGIPKGVLNVVHGGKDVVDALCTHELVKAISFVGSTAVGTHVYRLGSEHGKRVQSMMGAKNHAVVLPDANREQTLNALAGAGFGAAGQRCMATSVVVLVGASQQWLPDLIEKAKTLKVNAGSESGTDIGPVVSRAAKQRILGLIEAGVKEGATLALDGRGVKVSGYEEGNFIGPTIFSDVTTEMEIYRTEIFGPVLVVLSVPTLDDAIALVNRWAMVWGSSRKAAQRRASSRAISTWARWGSTFQFRYRCRSSASRVHAARSLAISARMASRSCSFTRRPRRSPRAGSTTQPSTMASTPPSACAKRSARGTLDHEGETQS